MGQTPTKIRQHFPHIQQRLTISSFPKVLQQEYKVKLTDLLTSILLSTNPFYLFFFGLRLQLRFHLMMNKPEPTFRGKHKKRSHLVFLESKELYLYDLEQLPSTLDKLFHDLLEDYHHQLLIYPDYKQHNNRGISLYLI